MSKIAISCIKQYMLNYNFPRHIREFPSLVILEKLIKFHHYPYQIAVSLAFCLCEMIIKGVCSELFGRFISYHMDGINENMISYGSHN